jgi:hypothetical protein
MRYYVIKVIIAAVVPVLFIWSINTLFNTGILLTFKTWLAGFILIQIFNFYARSKEVRYDPEEYYEDEEDEEEYDEEYEDENYEEDPDERRKPLRETLKVYKGHKDKKNNPPREPKKDGPYNDDIPF